MKHQTLRHFGESGLAALLAALACVTTAQAAPDVGTDSASAIHGQTRVMISEFDVEFYTQLHGEGRRTGAVAAVTATLDGVSPETRQAITDQAYTQTVAALTAAGFEVVDPQAAADNADYQGLVGKYGLTSPYTFTDDKFGEAEPAISQIVAPTGKPAYFSSSVARGDLRQRIDVQNQGRGATEGEVAKALGVTLLHVHYLASFGLVSASKHNALLEGSVARAAIDVEPVLYPNDTEIQFVTASGARTFTTSRRPRHSGAVYLKSPLAGDAALFTSGDATTRDEKRGDAVTNALSLFTGQKQKTHSSTVAPSSEQAYRDAYAQLIGEAATAMVGGLTTAR